MDVIDTGVAMAVQQAADAGRKIACSKGCNYCCANHAIPITPLEIMGVSWHATELLSGEVRHVVKKQLTAWNDTILQVGARVCPFNVRGVCSVYPVRPIACRQFCVFDTQCVEGENVYEERRQDVLTPLYAFKERADRIMLAHYGFSSDAAARTALEDEYLRKNSQLLLQCDWTVLGKKM